MILCFIFGANLGMINTGAKQVVFSCFSAILCEQDGSPYTPTEREALTSPVQSSILLKPTGEHPSLFRS